MNQVIIDVTHAMESYEFHLALKSFHTFFWHDFCDNYLEYIKYRIYGTNVKAKQAAQYVLLYVLKNSLKLFAPVAPHITEEMYHGLFAAEAKKSKSIHRSSWPKPQEIDENLFSVLDQFNRIVGEIRQHKSKNKLAQNAELPLLKISAPDELPIELLAELKLISKIKKVTAEKAPELQVFFS